MAYNISVYTGDRNNAGTNAQVYIVMHGEGVSSNKMFLNNGNFKRASVDKFTIFAPITLCPLKTLVVGHDNTGHDPEWFLDKVNSKF